jgi:hypothetical protein
MGTFAGTANVDYRLSFVDQGKQNSVFRLQKQKEIYEETNKNYPFANGLNGLAHLWFLRYFLIIFLM